MTIRRLHLELGSAPAANQSQLTLYIGSHAFNLDQHSDHTRLQSAQTNRAMALMPEDERRRFTHYAEVPAELFPEGRLTRVRVVSPDSDPDIYLPVLHHVSLHVPHHDRRQHFLRQMATNQACLHPKLHGYGATLAAAANADLEGMMLDAGDLLTPWDIAVTLLFHHPELATNKPHTAAIIMNNHIAPPLNPDQYNLVRNLATVISKQGPASSKGGWAQIADSVDHNGKPLTFGYDIGDRKQGDRILHYKLSDKTQGAMSAPVSRALRSAKNDEDLQNQSWSVSQGQTAIQFEDTGSAPHSLRSGAANGPTFKWTVQEKTPGHGMTTYSDTLHFSDADQFSIDVKNTYLRTVCAYAQFFDADGNAISNPAGWEGQLPDWLKSFETDQKKYICAVSAVNTIMGIPMPTDATNLSFRFPSDAASLKLLFGGLGTTQWDGDVDVAGALLTGLFQYGIPTFFLVAEAGITSTKWFNDFAKNHKNIAAALKVAFPIVGSGSTSAAASANTKDILLAMGDAAVGIIFQAGLEALALYITGTVTVQQLMEQAPFVGWALRIASIALDVEEMAVSTGEILSSPATFSVNVKRAMDLKLTLSPDPKHGEPKRPETAVWPAVSNRYQVIVQYQGGTNAVLKGSMPLVTSSAPLELTFSDLAAGGKIQIIAGIYSQNGWLCGQYQSEWLDAVPDSGSTTKAITAHITETLVPLTQDTQHLYKEKTIYDRSAGKYVWHAGDRPTSTVANLDCSSTSFICKPVAITMNNNAFQVGYTWKAGAKFACQNLSMLAEPQSRYKVSDVDFPTQPFIAYDQFGSKVNEQGISPSNFILDSRGGEYHLRRIDLMDGQSSFGLNNPDLKSWGRFNLPNPDGVVVHPDGKVIAVNWKASKMEILQLPDEPVADKDAPAALMVSGQGVRQGLMQGPAALCVAPDGRVLILETNNQRIQAFDTTGNPVPCFLGERLFTLNLSDYATALDQQEFPDNLRDQFEQHSLTYLFDLDNQWQSDLDRSSLSDGLINAFADQGIYLTYAQDQRSDHNVSSFVTVNEAGRAWTVTDPGRNADYHIAKNGTALNVFDLLNNVTVTVRAPGKVWILQDGNSAESYYLAADAADSSKLNVNRYLSFMPLYNPDGRTDITYLDVAAEAGGYLYVLSYTGDGKDVSNYRMDIYRPDGSFMVRTPDPRLQPRDPQYISAAHLAVDAFRNVYTLNYEATPGPGDIAIPSIGHWTPTPPLFNLAATHEADFAAGNMAQIRGAFSSTPNPITLSPAATVTTVSAGGYWQVVDGNKTYDVIRTAVDLQVYDIPAASL